MAIPNGTKFHGVAPHVETQNKGSQLANSDRDVYTFPEDFKVLDTVQISYNGKIINLGAGNNAPFNGDTVEWGGIQSPTTQTSVIIFPYEVKIQSIYFKMARIINASVDFNYVFNLYTSGDLAADPNQAGTWTQLGALTTELTNADNLTAPGFVEDVSAQNLVIPAGSMFALAGIELAGSIGSSTTEAVVGIVVTKA
jgi:hypothetical protein